jgi:hypothetical protein
LVRIRKLLGGDLDSGETGWTGAAAAAAIWWRRCSVDVAGGGGRGRGMGEKWRRRRETAAGVNTLAVWLLRLVVQ